MLAIGVAVLARSLSVQASCHDFAGVYDAEAGRFDHHQRGFDQVSEHAGKSKHA